MGYWTCWGCRVQLEPKDQKESLWIFTNWAGSREKGVNTGRTCFEIHAIEVQWSNHCVTIDCVTLSVARSVSLGSTPFLWCCVHPQWNELCLSPSMKRINWDLQKLEQFEDACCGEFCRHSMTCLTAHISAYTVNFLNRSSTIWSVRHVLFYGPKISFWPKIALTPFLVSRLN